MESWEAKSKTLKFGNSIFSDSVFMIRFRYGMCSSLDCINYHVFICQCVCQPNAGKIQLNPVPGSCVLNFFSIFVYQGNQLLP